MNRGRGGRYDDSRPRYGEPFRPAVRDERDRERWPPAQRQRSSERDYGRYEPPPSFDRRRSRSPGYDYDRFRHFQRPQSPRASSPRSRFERPRSPRQRSPASRSNTSRRSYDRPGSPPRSPPHNRPPIDRSAFHQRSSRPYSTPQHESARLAGDRQRPYRTSPPPGPGPNGYQTHRSDSNSHPGSINSSRRSSPPGFAYRPIAKDLRPHSPRDGSPARSRSSFHDQTQTRPDHSSWPRPEGFRTSSKALAPLSTDSRNANNHNSQHSSRSASAVPHDVQRNTDRPGEISVTRNRKQEMDSTGFAKPVNSTTYSSTSHSSHQISSTPHAPEARHIVDSHNSSLLGQSRLSPRHQTPIGGRQAASVREVYKKVPPTGPSTAIAGSHQSQVRSPLHPSTPTGPRSAVAVGANTSTVARQTDYLADLTAIIPGGKLLPVADPAAARKIALLEEDAERLRKQVDACQIEKRARLRDWEARERDCRRDGVRSELAESQLHALSGEVIGGAAF